MSDHADALEAEMERAFIINVFRAGTRMLLEALTKSIAAAYVEVAAPLGEQVDPALWHVFWE